MANSQLLRPEIDNLLSLEGKPVDENTDNLTQARQAYTARDWATAAAHFDIVAAERLTADDLAFTQTPCGGSAA